MRYWLSLYICIIDIMRRDKNSLKSKCSSVDYYVTVVFTDSLFYIRFIDGEILVTLVTNSIHTWEIQLFMQMGIIYNYFHTLCTYTMYPQVNKRFLTTKQKSTCKQIQTQFSTKRFYTNKKESILFIAVASYPLFLRWFSISKFRVLKQPKMSDRPTISLTGPVIGEQVLYLPHHLSTIRNPLRLPRHHRRAMCMRVNMCTNRKRAGGFFDW